MDRYLHQAGCSSDASIGEVSESAGGGTEQRQREDEQVGLQTQATLLQQAALCGAVRCHLSWMVSALLAMLHWLQRTNVWQGSGLTPLRARLAGQRWQQAQRGRPVQRHARRAAGGRERCGRSRGCQRQAPESAAQPRAD